MIPKMLEPLSQDFPIIQEKICQKQILSMAKLYLQTNRISK
jgi:hypothetical protein